MTKFTGETNWKRLRSMKDEDIDYSDIPPLPDDDNFWAKAEIVIPQKKKAISIRLDQDVIGWFKNQGDGYQSRINAVLRSYIKNGKRMPS